MIELRAELGLPQEPSDHHRDEQTEQPIGLPRNARPWLWPRTRSYLYTSVLRGSRVTATQARVVDSAAQATDAGLTHFHDRTAPCSTGLYMKITIWARFM